jgi:hypothetical protein
VLFFFFKTLENEAYVAKVSAALSDFAEKIFPERLDKQQNLRVIDFLIKQVIRQREQRGQRDEGWRDRGVEGTAGTVGMGLSIAGAEHGTIAHHVLSIFIYFNSGIGSRRKIPRLDKNLYLRDRKCSGKLSSKKRYVYSF